MPIEGLLQQRNSQSFEAQETKTMGHHIVTLLREATDASSPLTQLLEDPSILELSGSKRSGRRTSRSPRRKKQSSSAMALALVEEHQAGYLKRLLHKALEHLEYEIQRADEASARAEYAELREKEAIAKLVSMEAAKLQAEGACEGANADKRRQLIQLEGMERELQRLKASFTRLERLKDEFEASSIKAKESSRGYQNALKEYLSREEGKEQGRQVAMQKCFDEGREEGWEAGNEEGFEEGRKAGFQEGRRAGRKEGLREGREQGVIEERRNALEAFDRFLNEEMDGYDHNSRSERIRRWAESIYRHPHSVPA